MARRVRASEGTYTGTYAAIGALTRVLARPDTPGHDEFIRVSAPGRRYINPQTLSGTTRGLPQPFTCRMTLTHWSRIGRIVSSFSDGRLG
jgi:hypothetical protein